MISLPQIPVEISPRRLAAETSLSDEEAGLFLERTLLLLEPAGVFDEVDPLAILDSISWEREGDGSVIVGLCSLGPKAACGPNGKNDGRLRSSLTRIALRDVLDYIEYRIRLFLRPLGRQPGNRLLPGCPELPLTANKAILDHFRPENSLGLTLLPSGEIDGRTGLAFIYTTAVKSESKSGLCANCARTDCPGRV